MRELTYYVKTGLKLITDSNCLNCLNCFQFRKKNNPFQQSLKYLQNKIWKINKRVEVGAGPTKNPNINKREGTINWNWRIVLILEKFNLVVQVIQFRLWCVRVFISFDLKGFS